MTVVNPKSISGINSITMASGSDNLLTIHSNNTTERVRVDSSGNLTATSFSGDGSSLTGIAGTANVRTGILDVAGVGTFRGDVNIPDKIIHLGDTDTAIRFSGADTITAETAGSEAFRIDSNGHVALKLTDPHLYYSKDLVVKAISEGGITIRANGGSDWNYLLFASGNSGAARYSGYVGFDHGNDKLRLSTNEEVSAKNVELRSDGNFHISDGNLVLASGHGIDFSATSDGSGVSNVSELLDDYEEGTWTPAITASSGNSATTNVYHASYTKVGNQVFISCYIGAGANSSTGGYWTVTGLPFTSKSTNHYFSISVGYWNSLQGNINHLTGTVQPGDTSVLMRGTTSATTATSNLSYAGYVANGTEFLFSATYLTA